ncbi:MAG: copper chaperone PCu(A)C [Vitreimonas sp.]
MRPVLLLAVVLFAAACGAPPATQQAPRALEVQDAWAAPTPGGVDVAAGYLTIVNDSGADDRLMSATSPRAERVEVHDMSFEGGVMRMRAVEDGLAVPAGTMVALEPGGQHLMFHGVRAPFAEGERIPVTLKFAQAGDVSVELPVQRAAAAAPAHVGH